MQLLPYKNLKLEQDISLREIWDIPGEGPVGYIIDVDLEITVEIRDRFKEYPPTPETTAPDADWFSEFQRDLAENTT